MVPVPFVLPLPPGCLPRGDQGWSGSLLQGRRPSLRVRCVVTA